MFYILLLHNLVDEKIPETMDLVGEPFCLVVSSAPVLFSSEAIPENRFLSALTEVD